MMKKSITRLMSKFIIMLMTVMMLSVSVIAKPVVNEFKATEQTTTQINATVRINNEIDSPIYNGVAPIVLDKQGFTTLFPVDPSAVHQYQDVPTVMDALYKYLLVTGKPLATNIQIGWDTYSITNGAYISTFLTTGTEEIDSHYSSVPGESYWKGNSWGLYVNGQKTVFYASNLMLQEGDVIELIYEYTEEHW